VWCHGRRGGLISTLGSDRNLVQVLPRTVGLAAIVASSAEAFSAIKYLGAAYLIFLGSGAHRQRRTTRTEVTRTRSPPRLYADGVMVGALTPSSRYSCSHSSAVHRPGDRARVGPDARLGLIFNVIARDRRLALRAGGRERRRAPPQWLHSRGLRRQRRILPGLGAVAALSHSHTTKS